MRRADIEAAVLTGMVEGRGARGRQRWKSTDEVTGVAGGHLKPAESSQVTRDNQVVLHGC